MYGLTQLGVIHTAISLVALAAAILSLLRFGRIVPGGVLGKLYIWTTVLTCVTGFGIYQHGGFGKPHALGVITLAVLALAGAADRGRLGARSIYIATLSYSITLVFHMIPAITETTTRLPLGAPLLPNTDAPELKAATGVLFLLYLVGGWWQVRRLKAESGAAHTPNPGVRSPVST